MITDLIVLLSVALAAAFSIAWLVRPDLRERIERPSQGFQDRVRQYDRRIHGGGDEG